MLSASDESSQISSVHTLTLEENETWSILDIKWLQQWINYTGFDLFKGKTIPVKTESRPGPIDNSRLIDNEIKEVSVLKRGIQEHSDYGIVNKQVANYLYAWYLPNKEDQEKTRFDRPVITVGLHKTAQLQLFPTVLKLIPLKTEDGEPDESKASFKTFNNKSTFTEIRQQLLADEEKTATIDEKSDVRTTFYIYSLSFGTEE
jgi:hypothetical protein